MKYRTITAVFILVLLTVIPRLYRITAPVADWHSFRQTDTASVARQYVKYGIDLLHPTYQDLSNIQSGKDNPKGWRMVEFPLYQGTAALLSRSFSRVPTDVWLRLISVAASAVSAVMLFVIVGNSYGFRTGMIASMLFAVLPYSVFYGRTTLPEPLAVALALVSVAVMSGVQSRHGPAPIVRVAVSGIAAGLAILTKPTSGFLLLAVPVLMLRIRGFSVVTLFMLVWFAVSSLGPFAWWRNWIRQFPEGIPVFEWLFNKDNIRFRGAWFQWLFGERIGRLMLGYWGLVPFGIGLIVPRPKKDPWTVHLLGLGSLSYLSVIAAGNVQHDYYQIIILPAVAAYLSLGIDWLLRTKAFHAATRTALVFISVAFMLAFSWYTVRTYYWINRPEIVEAGQAADRLLPPGAKVIAPYNGDTTFLYQTNRTGWPLGFDIDKKIAQGATHYVTVSPTNADYETMTLARDYTVLVRNDRYAIIDLTRPGEGK